MNNNNTPNTGFINGFLMGLLVGGGAVMLLGTEKGNKLLEKLKEEGLEGISEIGDIVEDKTQDYKKIPVLSPSTQAPRRLFRGIRKKN